jgi:cell fate regulator YaaT (PSP1 superfamily)
MDLPTAFEEFDIVEVRFKGGRKDFYRNINKLELVTGDPVVVDVPNGHHIGHVSLKGELVRLQMLKKKVENGDEIRTIYRVANERDLEKFNEVRDLEGTTMFRARSIIHELNLRMKLSDVEYQADRSKATFFYSADDRVDFRDLIKKLAEEFKVRIEMRQISLRHEAGRLGGIGSCGRELCCSTWLTDFKSVSTTAARYQNLSLNPSKLSGQCGRIKCCLNYELETYMEALKDIPTVSRPLQTQQGDAFLQKTDIFKKMMWFGYRGDNNWYPVPVERVQEILNQNAKGVVVDALLIQVQEEPKQNEFVAQVEGNLERLDDKFKSKKKKKKKKKRPEDAQQTAAPAAGGNARPERPAPRQERQPGEQGQRPRRQAPFKNRNNAPEGGKEATNREGSREIREVKPARTSAPKATGNAGATTGTPDNAAAQQPKRQKPRRPFKGKKPDQANPRNDA